MKIEQIIVQYLYANKEVTLQGIGKFILNPHVQMPSGNEKDFSMPENAIHFEYDLRAIEDEGLLNFIVQHTRKMRPLASSDLDSYIALAKQLLNIGKPLVISGIGTIQKNMLGEYQFTPGVFIPSKMEEAPKELKEKKEEAVSFESEIRSKGKNNVTIAVIFLLLVLIGFGIYYFIKKKNAQQEVAATEQPAIVAAPVTDTIKPTADTVKKDTVAKPLIDSSLLKPSTFTTIIPKDSFSFKVVIKNYRDSESMNKAYKRLSIYNHSLIKYSNDSTYKLAIPFMNPLSDTSRIRDSLRIFFGGHPYILR